MVIRARRLQWLGHIERMENEKTEERVTMRGPNSGRKKEDHNKNGGTLS